MKNKASCHGCQPHIDCAHLSETCPRGRRGGEEEAGRTEKSAVDLTLRTWAWASRRARGVELPARDEGLLVLSA